MNSILYIKENLKKIHNLNILVNGWRPQYSNELEEDKMEPKTNQDKNNKNKNKLIK